MFTDGTTGLHKNGGKNLRVKIFKRFIMSTKVQYAVKTVETISTNVKLALWKREWDLFFKIILNFYRNGTDLFLYGNGPFRKKTEMNQFLNKEPIT